MYKGKISFIEAYNSQFSILHEMYRIGFIQYQLRKEEEEKQKEAEEIKARYNKKSSPANRDPKIPSLPPMSSDELEEMIEEGM